MYMVFCPEELRRSSLHCTALNLKKITSHKSRQFTPHHFTYLHSIPTWIPLLVTTFFLNVLSLQGRETSKPERSWFQVSIVLFTKEYLSTSVLLFPSSTVKFVMLLFWGRICYIIHRQSSGCKIFTAKHQNTSTQQRQASITYNCSSSRVLLR